MSQESQILDKGPGVIIFDNGGTPVTFDANLEDFVLKSEVDMQDVNEAQHGSTPVDQVTMGRLITLEVAFTRVSLDNLAEIFPNAVLSGTSTKQLVLGNAVGDSMYKYAKEVCIKPIINGTVSIIPSQWIILYKTFPKETIELPYGTGQRTWKVIFTCYPDQTSGNVGNLAKVGLAS